MSEDPGIRELGVVTYARRSRTELNAVVLRVQLDAAAGIALSARGPRVLDEILGLRVMLVRQRVEATRRNGSA